MEEKEKYSNNEIIQMLFALTSKVDEGFKGVHIRQDLTNGNVKCNTEYRLKASATIGVLKWLVGVFGVGTIVNLILTITNKINAL